MRPAPVPAAAALLLAAAAAGCCGLTRSAGRRGLDRDSPERAFEFVRAAFAEDATADQYESFHPEFVEAQGLDREKYSLGRSLSPGVFERAAALLRGAVLDGPVERGVLQTARGPRAAARVRLRTPGGAGVFVLVDEPRFRLATTDPEIPEVSGAVSSVPGAVRVADGRVQVRLDADLFAVPAGGAEVLRITIHHDWLLHGVERLEGLEEFLGDVRSAAEKAAPEKGKAPGEGRP